jgi:trigger factor
MGDSVVFDFEGFKDGKPFDGGKAEKFTLELGSGQFIPGFEEQLVGLTAGDEKDVEVSFPESYHVKDLAGQPVIFKCKVHDVKCKKEAELTDEFVKDLNIPEVKTVDELKEKIEEAITNAKLKNVNAKYENELFDAIIKDSKIDVPESFLKREIEQLTKDFGARLQQQGMDIKKFKEMTGQTDDQIKAELQKDALRRIQVAFMLDAIAAEEKIVVSDEEIDAEIKRVADANNAKVEDVAKNAPRDQISYFIRNQKIMEIISK